MQQQQENEQANLGDFKGFQQECFKDSKNPTILEVSMNELLSECGLDSCAALQTTFEDMFHSTLREMMRNKMQQLGAVDSKYFSEVDDIIRFFIYMQRMIRNMYMTYDDDTKI